MVNKVLGWFLVGLAFASEFGLGWLTPSDIEDADEHFESLYQLGVFILGFMFVLTEEIKDAFRNR